MVALPQGADQSTFKIESLTAPYEHQGSAVVDQHTGMFYYRPAVTDVIDISVKLSVAVRTGRWWPRKKTIIKTITISPRPQLKAECECALPSSNAPLDPSNSKYWTATVLESPDEKMFNYIKQKTMAIELIGKTIVLDERHPHGPFRYFQQNQTSVEHLSIAAETLIVRSPVNVFGASLDIRAQTVIFENKGVIDVSPVACTLPRPHARENEQDAPGNGNVGLNAQPIAVFAQRIQHDGTRAQRIIARGGTGCLGGLGYNGTARVMREITDDQNVYSIQHADPVCDRDYFTYIWAGWELRRDSFRYAAYVPNDAGEDVCYAHIHEENAPVLDQYGIPRPIGDPQPGGVPGRGGDGSVATVSANMRQLLDISGGSPGDATPSARLLDVFAHQTFQPQFNCLTSSMYQIYHRRLYENNVPCPVGSVTAVIKLSIN
jgi:hypothetical protein